MKNRWGRVGPLVAVTVLAVVLAAACSADTTDVSRERDSPSSPSADADGGGSSYEPLFTETDCVPDSQGIDDVDCGELTVPMNREDPGAGDVVLPVTIVRSTAPDPLPDPIVYFSGGPGGDGTAIAGGMRTMELGGRRDMILFDQRGTGEAVPSLDCPEIEEAIWDGLASADDAAAELARGREALEACRDRLVAEGVDLNAFDTPTTAADAEDLRLALGIDEWNVFGVSYGTTVAIEMLRTYPDPIRSAVLDSVYPPDVANTADRLVANGDRAFTELFDACAQDPACQDAYGDLAAQLDALVADWDDDPYVASATDPHTGETRRLQLTGPDLVAGMFNAMYDERLIPVLPSLFGPLAARDAAGDAIVAEMAATGVSFLNSEAEGVALGVDCADRQHLGDSDLETLIEERPEFQLLALVGATDLRCEAWDVASVDSAFNELAPSDVPVLSLGNQFDPITPPSDSERAADALGGEFVFFPSLAHGAVFGNPCARDIMGAFVDDPGAPVDDSCAHAIPPPVFIAG